MERIKNLILELKWLRFFWRQRGYLKSLYARKLWERQGLAENMGVKRTAELIEFCFPGLKVVTERPTHMKNGDVTALHLKREFEKLNAEYKLYDNYEAFKEALLMFIPATIEENGIYTNFFYTKKALTANMERATNLPIFNSYPPFK